MVFLCVFLYTSSQKDKGYDRDRRTMHTGASQELDDAHKRAKHIIEQSVEKARDILVKTEYIKEDVVKKLEEDMQEVSAATVAMLRNEAVAFNKEYKILLESIQVEHAKMLEEARMSLQDIEQVKQAFQGDLHARVDTILSEAEKNLQTQTVGFDKEYQELLENTKKEYLTRAQNTLQKLEKIPEQEMIEFQAILKKETVTAQQLLGQRISDLFGAAEKEVVAYKNSRLKEVEASLQDITGKVVEEVIGAKLTKADHEALVLRALERAKNEGVLGASVKQP